MRIPLLLALTACLGAQEPSALFLENCAACHGERGDGKGTTPLPKPARSFLDGGFSYGNTVKAIGRTIEHGIPGTPMPSFAEALSPEQRSALVDYVIGLGPPRKEVKVSETILSVTDRPQVVRGYLPALGEGLPEWPRGLLVGLTSGTTFQYRADDLRLLAVRQGELVERRDWGGRGGSPLRPLGAVTHLVDGGNPPSPWSVGGTPLRARLTRTAVRGERVTLGYDLHVGGEVVARVEETPAVIRSRAGSGFVREYRITVAGPEEVDLGLRWSAPLEEAAEEEELSVEYFKGASVYEQVFTYVDEGGARLVAAAWGSPLGRSEAAIDATSCRLTLPPQAEVTVRVFQAVLVDAGAKRQFLTEMYD